MTRRFLWAALFSALLLVACQKAPVLSITGPTNIELSADGSSGTITFTANRDWTISTSDSWVSVSPSRGEASDGPVAVAVRCGANTTYEDRTATVTIKMEDLTQTVTVKQPANLGIILPSRSYNLESGASSIAVEVQANVTYSVSTSADWIKQAGTKGLTSTTYIFSIEENQTYDSREGTITIKSQNSSVADQLITVKQAQKDALIVKDKSFDMPYGGGEIEFKVEANIDFDVKPDVDWIHYLETKALSNSTVRLSVDENPTYEAREGKIEIKQKNGTLSHTITVKEAGRIAVTSLEINKTELKLTEGDTEILVATVKPDNATDKTVTWSSSNTAIATIDDDGRVTAIKEGSATITAKAGEKSATCLISIAKLPEGAVNMGLSVLWAECNIGASAPEGYGDYYAWGEIETKSYYSWSTYKWCNNGSFSNLTKYNSDSSMGIVDNKLALKIADDVAHVKHGDKWRMPTEEEWKELLDNSTWTWTKRNGVNGGLITSNKNGNSIFLPAAGFMMDASLYGDVLNSIYWSSSLYIDDASNALASYFGIDGSVELRGEPRDVGLCVRPVYGINDNSIPVSSVSLNKTELTLNIGESEVLIATVKPDNATDDTVIWSSTDDQVASVEENGKVTAINGGTATITALAGEKKATCEVTVKSDVPVSSIELDKTTLSLVAGEQAFLTATILPEDATDKTTVWSSSDDQIATVDDQGRVTAVGKGNTTIFVRSGDICASCKVFVKAKDYGVPSGGVDLGLSVVWSEKNYGASSPSDVGGYYLWGDATGNGTIMFFSTPNVDIISGTQYDITKKNMGIGWRLPTRAELSELFSSCSSSASTVNGVKGVTLAGPSGQSVFIPLSGMGMPADGAMGNYSITSKDNGYLMSDESYGSSGSRFAYIGVFNQSGSFNWTSYNAPMAKFPIRPVYEVPEDYVPVSSVSLNKPSLELTVGLSETLVATIYPDNATENTVTWSSGDNTVAIVDQNGKVTAVKIGTTTIMAKAEGATASCTITVLPNAATPDAVDLGLSVKWASFNLGATKPEEFGDYYAWGEVEPKEEYSWTTYKWADGDNLRLTKYCPSENKTCWKGSGNPDGKMTLDPEDDVVRIRLGGKWRMPTKEEIEELFSNCTYSLDTQNGIVGFRVTSSINGNSIFLPSNVAFNITNPESPDSYGCRSWSSSLFGPPLAPDSGACLLIRNHPEIGMKLGGVSRDAGLPIRPVTE